MTDSLNRQNDLIKFLQQYMPSGGPDLFTGAGALSGINRIANGAARFFPGGSGVKGRLPGLGPATAFMYGMGDLKGNPTTALNGNEQNLIPPDQQAKLRAAAYTPLASRSFRTTVRPSSRWR